jgi:H+-translocating NAD(P) transhydrogenase subunit alpha
MESQLHVLGVVVFVLAGFVGHYVIHSVPTLLHTPLMSATNAISAIAVVAAVVVAGGEPNPVTTTLGVIAVASATTNVVGGFLITNRMLKMFKGGGAGNAEKPGAPKPSIGPKPSGGRPSFGPKSKKAG